VTVAIDIRPDRDGLTHDVLDGKATAVNRRNYLLDLKRLLYRSVYESVHRMGGYAAIGDLRRNAVSV
jgi:hypothetical protein